MGEKEKAQFKKEVLENCTTVGNLFNYLSNYFDLFNTSIPLIYKPVVCSAILSIVQILNPKRK